MQTDEHVMETPVQSLTIADIHANEFVAATYDGNWYIERQGNRCRKQHY